MYLRYLWTYFRTFYRKLSGIMFRPAPVLHGNLDNFSLTSGTFFLSLQALFLSAKGFLAAIGCTFLAFLFLLLTLLGLVVWLIGPVLVLFSGTIQYHRFKKSVKRAVDNL